MNVPREIILAESVRAVFEGASRFAGGSPDHICTATVYEHGPNILVVVKFRRNWSMRVSFRPGMVAACVEQALCFAANMARDIDPSPSLCYPVGHYDALVTVCEGEKLFLDADEPAPV